MVQILLLLLLTIVDLKYLFSAAQESSYHISQGWQCDFYFGYGLGNYFPTLMFCNLDWCDNLLRVMGTSQFTYLFSCCRCNRRSSFKREFSYTSAKDINN